MTTKLTLFGVDCCTDAFLPHPGCCALSSSRLQLLFADDTETNTTNSSNTRLLTISKEGESSSSSVCLVVHVSADIIDDSHLIIPEWALSVLKVSHGTMSVLVKPVLPVVEDAHDVTEVRFVYQAYQSYRHWDNVATSTPFSFPDSWSCEWPALSKQVIQKMLPLLLHPRRFLIDRSLVVLDVLDISMMFQVQLIGKNDEDMNMRRIVQVGPHLSKYLTVIIPSTETKMNSINADDASEYHPSYYCLDGFFSTIYRRITSICDAAVMRRPISSEDSWKGVHSMLISASEGAGKSSLLLEIQKSLQAAVRMSGGQQGSAGVQFVCLTGKGIELPSDRNEPWLSNSNQIDTKPIIQSTSVRRRMAIRENIQRLIQLLQPQESSNEGDSAIMSITKASTSTPIRMIIIIDDLDKIFAANGSTSLEDETAGDAARRDTVCLRAAYHLRQLLQDLSIQQSHDMTTHTYEDDQIIVIGATRMAINMLPRSHQGAPEFELTLNLTRPARQDREQLIFHMLEALNTQWVLEELEDDISDNVGHVSVPKNEENFNMHVWACRMAGLTAGYLPGDLEQVMRRATNTYLGQVSMANHAIPKTTLDSTMETRQTRPCLSWRSMLAVIASQPPRQLQQLSTIVAGVGGSDGAKTNLSWNDFGGYDEIKQTLQRLINSSKITTTRSTTSQQSVHVQHHETSRSNMAIDGTPLTLQNYLKISSSSMRGIVFHGPPGCGKSYLARIVAAEAKMNFVSVRSTELLSKYFGQTEASIRSVFKQARAAAPCVVFFDEFDALAYKRGMSESASDGGGTGSLQTRILSTFLNELDGILSQHHGNGDGEDGIIVLAACNNIDILDEALLRPGRLQHHIRLELPNRDDIAAMLQLHIRSLRCADDMSIDTLADTLAKQIRNVTGAHVESLCRRAIIMRIREEAKKNNIHHMEENDSIPSISMHNFLEALEEMYPKITPSLPPSAPLPAFKWNANANFIF